MPKAQAFEEPKKGRKSVLSRFADIGLKNDEAEQAKKDTNEFLNQYAKEKGINKGEDLDLGAVAKAYVTGLANCMREDLPVWRLSLFLAVKRDQKQVESTIKRVLVDQSKNLKKRWKNALGREGQEEAVKTRARRPHNEEVREESQVSTYSPEEEEEEEEEPGKLEATHDGND